MAITRNDIAALFDGTVATVTNLVDVPNGPPIMFAPADPNRRSIRVRNEGANDLYLGGVAFVNGQAGWRLPAGDVEDFPVAGPFYVASPPNQPGQLRYALFTDTGQ